MHVCSPFRDIKSMAIAIQLVAGPSEIMDNTYIAKVVFSYMYYSSKRIA